MRVIEAAVAGVIVAAVVGVIAWRVEADVVLVAAAAFLVGFAAWAGKGRTTQKYGGGRRRSRRSH